MFVGIVISVNHGVLFRRDTHSNARIRFDLLPLSPEPDEPEGTCRMTVVGGALSQLLITGIPAHLVSRYGVTLREILC